VKEWEIVSEEMAIYEHLEDVPNPVYILKENKNDLKYRGADGTGNYIPLSWQESPPEEFYVLEGIEFKRAAWIPSRFKHDEEKDIVEKKRIDLLKKTIPSFEYINEISVNQCYDAHFLEPKIKEWVVRIIKENQTEISTQLPDIISGSISNETLQELVYSVRIKDQSTEAKFNQYLKHILGKQSVLMNLEYLDINSTELAQFEEAISSINSKFKINLNTSDIQSFKKTLEQRAADEILDRLKRADGEVIIKGDFLVKGLPNDEYELIYRHPISNTTRKTVGQDVLLVIPLDRNKLDKETQRSYDKASNSYEEFTKKVEQMEKGGEEKNNLGNDHSNLDHSKQKIHPPIKRNRVVYGRIRDGIDPLANNYELSISPIAIW
jgi:hypothetical protein